MSLRRDIVAAREVVARLGRAQIPDAGPLTQLAGSLDALVRGNRSQALARASRACSGDRVAPIVEYGAGLVLHLCGDLEGAYQHLEGALAASSGKVAAQIADATRALAASTGHADLRRAMLRHLLAQDKPRPGHRFELAELLVEQGELDAMEEILDELVASSELPVAAQAWTMWTRYAPKASLHARMQGWISQRRDSLDPSTRLALAACWIELGAFEKAEALLEHDAGAEVERLRARWSLWRGRYGELETRCEGHEDGAWLRALARARGSKAGLRDFDRALAEGSGCELAEAWRWRVELGLQHHEDPTLLRELLDRGRSRRDDDGVVAELLESLIGLRLASVDEARREARSVHADDAARAMIPVVRSALMHIDEALLDGLEALDDAGLEARIWQGLHELSGYRGGRVALVLGGCSAPRLGQVVRAVADPISEMEREALRWLRAGRLERAIACSELSGNERIAQLIRADAAWRCERPGEGLKLIATVIDTRDDELESWALAGLCGDSELARAALARVLNLAPAQVFGAIARCEARLESLLEAEPAPTEVRAVLEQIVVERLDGFGRVREEGRGLAELRRVQVQQLLRFARGFARLLNVDARLLERALASPPEPEWVDRGKPERARALLDAARRRKAPHVRRRPAPSLLRPEQIDQFVSRGFLRVEGCLKPEDAARWIATANQRILDKPERWVKGYGQGSPSLVGYDVEKPDSWTWSYMDVLGEHGFFIEDRAPRAWAAIGDLLGGHERVATWTWTDSAKPSFLPRGGEAKKVFPTDETWHIDDPRRAMTLEGLDHGLVCLVLLSSVGPGMGGTLLCPDSLGPVARTLAAHPAGYDFVDRQAGPKITRNCQEFVEATGDPGDVYFMHPLVMHSVAPNASKTIRWISNPLIHLRQPLVYDPAESATHSPVERAIAEALRA